MFSEPVSVDMTSVTARQSAFNVEGTANHSVAQASMLPVYLPAVCGQAHSLRFGFADAVSVPRILCFPHQRFRLKRWRQAKASQFGSKKWIYNKDVDSEYRCLLKF